MIHKQAVIEAKPASGPDELIAVKNLIKNFKVNDEELLVLRNLNFSIKRGTFTIIYGPSGSGKSTLLDTIMGLLPPTSGQVLLGTQSIYDLPAEKRTSLRASMIGSVYQSNYWVGSLTTLENVALPLYLANMSRGLATKVALEKLKQVGMEKYAHYNPNVMSGGQQQRVQMARALVTTPSIIVADEPTGNLDSKNGDAIMSLLAHIRTNQGGTVILVTHNLEYLSMSDHQIYIKDGEITETTGSYTMPPDLMNKVLMTLQTGDRVPVQSAKGQQK